MKILVCGKKGFVANKLIKFLKKKQSKFIAFSSKDVNLLSQSSSKKLKKIKKNKYIIVFLSTLTPDKGKDKKTFKKNILMMNNFFKNFPKRYIGHFVYVSSDAVYSMNDKYIYDKTRPNPQDLYGSMHLKRERIVKMKISKNNYVILRPVAVYGKGDTHNSYGPNRFFKQLKNNEKIKIFGKGQDVRSHFFVDDLVKIIDTVIVHKITGTLNISSVKSYKFIDIAKKIVKLFYNKYKYRGSIEFINNKNNPTRRYFKNLKVLKFINTKSLKNIDEGLNKLV